MPAASFQLSSLNGSNGFRIDAFNGFLEVSNGGDVNNDGFADILVEAISDISSNTDAFVIFGSNNNFGSVVDIASLTGTNGFSILYSNSINYSTSISFSTAGDINADGFDDLLLGDSTANSGFLVYGKASGFSPIVDLSELVGGSGSELIGSIADNQLGITVASLGDVNGDGIDDFFLGGPYSTSPNGQTAAGRSYVVFGKSDGFPADFDLSAIDGSNGFAVNGSDEFDYSGFAASAAGDLNGDGVNDILIGAPLADPAGSPQNSGEAYVVYGTTAGFGARVDLSDLDGANGFKLSGFEGNFFGAGPSERGGAGSSVSSAGDLNGDGFDDIVIGAGVAGDNSGGAYVLFGSSVGFDANIELSALNGANGFFADGFWPGSRTGASVSGGGDINGDGIDDLIIGAPYSGSLYGDEVAAFVIFGSTNAFAPRLSLFELDPAVGMEIRRENLSDASGSTVAIVGDVNGDGLDDVLIGSRTSGAYLVFGSTSFGASSPTPFEARVMGSELNIAGTTEQDVVARLRNDGTGAVSLGGLSFPLDGSNSGISSIDASQLEAGSIRLVGNGQNNQLVGSTQADLIEGSGGADTVFGGGGDDTVIGGSGTDSLDGGEGSDTYLVPSSRGSDVIADTGASGYDRVVAGIDGAAIGIVSLFGVEEISSGGFENVVVQGTNDANELDFSSIILSGIASIDGRSGNDLIIGTSNDDVIIGGAGVDTIFGGVRRPLWVPWSLGESLG